MERATSKGRRPVLNNCDKASSSFDWMPPLHVQTDLYKSINFYWAANMQLTKVTDGDAFHQQAQSSLANWVCGLIESAVQHKSHL